MILHLRSEANEQVLIGTNTRDAIYADFQDNPSLSTFQPLPYGYRAVLNILQMRQFISTSGILGCAKIVGKTPEVVPAGQTVVLECMASIC